MISIFQIITLNFLRKVINYILNFIYFLSKKEIIYMIYCFTCKPFFKSHILFYYTIIRIAQIYSLFRRLMLATSAQSPRDIQRDQIAIGL